MSNDIKLNGGGCREPPQTLNCTNIIFVSVVRTFMKFSIPFFCTTFSTQYTYAWIILCILEQCESCAKWWWWFFVYCIICSVRFSQVEWKWCKLHLNGYFFFSNVHVCIVFFIEIFASILHMLSTKQSFSYWFLRLGFYFGNEMLLGIEAKCPAHQKRYDSGWRRDRKAMAKSNDAADIKYAFFCRQVK